MLGVLKPCLEENTVRRFVRSESLVDLPNAAPFWFTFRTLSGFVIEATPGKNMAVPREKILRRFELRGIVGGFRGKALDKMLSPLVGKRRF